MSDDLKRFNLMETHKSRLSGTFSHIDGDGVYIISLDEEPEVCGGTGNHSYQPVIDCDECNPERFGGN